MPTFSSYRALSYTHTHREIHQQYGKSPGNAPGWLLQEVRTTGWLEWLGTFLSLSSLVTFDLQAEELKAKERSTMFESFIPITVHLVNTDQPSEASVPSWPARLPEDASSSWAQQWESTLVLSALWGQNPPLLPSAGRYSLWIRWVGTVGAFIEGNKHIATEAEWRKEPR